MVGLTYTTYVEQIKLLAAVDPSTDATSGNYDHNFAILIPSMISYASNRIARDLNLMSSSIAMSGTTFHLTAGNRRIIFPQTFAYADPSTKLTTTVSFMIAEQINLILPVGVSDPELGKRVPLLPTTKEFLDAVYGSSLVADRAQPKYFAPFNENFYFVGPVPDFIYNYEVVGIIRQADLSATVTPTFISTYLPDLFLMASMIYLSAYQRNFGKQSDDPQMAQSYEAQYNTLLKSAASEEARKVFEAAAWSSQAPATQASPTRG